MQSYHYYYDFRIGNTNAGMFEIAMDRTLIFQRAAFEIDGKREESIFSIMHTDGVVTAVKCRDNDWLAVEHGAELRYPTAAFPLLLPKVRDEYEYQAFNECSGEELGVITLKRNGAEIVEIHNQHIQRRFTMDGDIPGAIDWGGAISHLKPSRAAALAGSPLA